jgi:hypothetical protein
VLRPSLRPRLSAFGRKSCAFGARQDGTRSAHDGVMERNDIAQATLLAERITQLLGRVGDRIPRENKHEMRYAEALAQTLLDHLTRVAQSKAA